MMDFCMEIWEKYGWRGLSFNRVGYSRMPITGDRITSYSCYNEFHNIILEAKKKFKNEPIYMVSSSMGAVFTQRYLQDFKGRHNIDAVVCISSPWNVIEVAKHFHHSFFIRKVVLAFMQDVLRNHLHEEHLHKRLVELGIDYSRLKN